MNTTKPTTTASASQNCEHQYRETETGPIGATCVKCGDFARLKHTIRAEKPTAINWCSVAESDFEKANRYKAQAAQLAEALSLAQATIERLTLKYDIENVWGTLDMTQKALAAYEAR